MEISDNQGVQLARRGFLRLISALPAALAVFPSTPVQAALVPPHTHSETDQFLKSRSLCRLYDDYSHAGTRHLIRSAFQPLPVKRRIILPLREGQVVPNSVFRACS